MDLAAVLPFPVPPAPLAPGEPFTTAAAAAAGIGGRDLERRVRDGSLRRLLRGVYVAADVADTPFLRARAVGLRLGPRQVACGRTAAWVHGAFSAGGPVPLETAPADGREVVLVAGARFTSPVDTALDLARTLPEHVSLPLVDGLLRAGRLRHAALLDAARARTAGRGVHRLRRVAVLADGRAADPVESVLRLAWFATRLPTPVPGVLAGGVRVALGLPVQRFGVVGGAVPPGAPEAWRAAGWTVLELDPPRVLASPHEVLRDHLQRAYLDDLLSRC